LLKHSSTCPISARAWREYVEFVEDNPDLPTGWIDVHDQKDLSRRISDQTGVPHESPQALWIRKGKVGWHASHFDVTVENLARAAGSLPEKAKKQPA
jgi:bacillithiol system protein YtxJ